MRDAFSTPSSFKVPVAPHPTPYSTSSFLTHSKLPSNSIACGEKKLKPPVYNPYDKFTQHEFDAWIGNITGALKRALGQEEETESQECATTTSEPAETPLGYSTSRSSEEVSDWDGVEDSLAEATTGRYRKGKERDPLEGPGLRAVSGGPDSPIEVGSEIEDEADEDEADEDEVLREVSIDHWEETVREAARSARLERHEGYDEEPEEYFEEDGEEGEEDGEGEQRSVSPEDVIEIGSDDDVEEIQQSSPTRGSPAMQYPEEDEDQLDDEAYSDDDPDLPLHPSLHLSDSRVVGEEEEEEEYEGEDDGDSIQVINVDDEDDIQPESAEGDDVFPPHALHATATLIDQPPSLPDPWSGLETYAEDFYSGGDLLHVPAGASPRYAAHLLGEETDDIAFLTPGVITPNDAQSTPLADSTHLQRDENDTVDYGVALTASVDANSVFNSHQESPEPDAFSILVDDNSIDPALRDVAPLMSSDPSPLGGLSEDTLHAHIGQIMGVPLNPPLGDNQLNVPFDSLPTPPNDLEDTALEVNLPHVEQVTDILSSFADTEAATVLDAPTYPDFPPDASQAGGNVTDVDIDVDVFLPLGFNNGEQGFVEEALSEHALDPESEEASSNIDVVSLPGDAPVDCTILGVVEETVYEVDTDEPYPHLSLGVVISQDVPDITQGTAEAPSVVDVQEPNAQIEDAEPSIPQTQVNTPPSSPKYFVQESIPRTPSRISAASNAHNLITLATPTSVAQVDPSLALISSIPGTPTSLLSPAGTPRVPATPVSISVPQSVLDALQTWGSPDLVPPRQSSLQRLSPDPHDSPTLPNEAEAPPLEESVAIQHAPLDDTPIGVAPITQDTVATGSQQDQCDAALISSPDKAMEMEMQPLSAEPKETHLLSEEAGVVEFQPSELAANTNTEFGVTPPNYLGVTDVSQCTNAPPPLEFPEATAITQSPALPIEFPAAQPISEESIITNGIIHTPPLSPPIPSTSAGEAYHPIDSLAGSPIIGPHTPEPTASGDLPQFMTLSRRKSTDPVLLVDPFPYSLSTPGVELPGTPGSGDDTDDLDVSMSSNPTSESKFSDEKGDGSNTSEATSNTGLDDGEPPNGLILQYPSEPDVFLQPPDAHSVPKTDDHVDEPVQDKDADGEEDPEFSPEELIKQAEPSEVPVATNNDVPATPVIPHPEPELVVNDETKPEPSVNDAATTQIEADRTVTDENPELYSTAGDKPVLEVSLKPVPDQLPPTPPLTSPPPNRFASLSLEDLLNPLKRKHDSLTPPSYPKSNTKLKQHESPNVALAKSRDKGKSKAHDVVGLRVRNGSRPPSRSSSVASGGSDTFTQPSPTRQNNAPLESIGVPPPLFLAHSHSKLPKPNLFGNLPHNHIFGLGVVTGQSGKNHPPKTGSVAGTPSKSLPQRTFSSSASSPRTRSNCRFHRISLPREEGGPRVCFLVPGCSLLDRELMEEEEIEDHGDATIEDSKHMMPVNESLDFNLDLIGVLRQLVGVDLLREQEVYYLPSPEERTRILPQKTALSKITAREHDTPGSSHIRRSSLDSVASTRPPNSVAHSSGSSSTSTTKKPFGSDLGSSSAGRLTDAEDEGPRRHKSVVDTNNGGNMLDTEITIRIKPGLKAARRNRRVDADNAPYAPEDGEESANSDGGRPPKSRRKSRASNRGIKRTRTAGTEDGSSPEKAGKKLKISMSQP